MASRISRSKGLARARDANFVPSVEKLRSDSVTDEGEADCSATIISNSNRTGGPKGALRPKRLLLVASAGGHWIELCRLGPAFDGCDCLFVSTAGGLTAPIGDREVMQVIDSSRDSAWTMMRTLANIVPIIRNFRPDIVVSTGAAPGALALFIAKLYGVHTIWIDSIANSESISLSGRVVKLAADLRLTQWPELASDKHNLHYFGKIL